MVPELHITLSETSAWARFSTAAIGAMFGIIAALFTYVVTNWLGERKKRRDISTLGEIVIGSLQEEMANGIKLMQGFQRYIVNNGLEPTWGFLPKKSWDGMQTVSDDVLLRIIATSPVFSRQLRHDCKNYFEYICENINVRIEKKSEIGLPGVRLALTPFLSPENPGNYLVAAENLYNSLESVKINLKQNAARWLPK